MAPVRTWYGRSELKDAVLAHLDADYAAGAVLPLRVGDASVRYWYVERDDLDAMRGALGIPRSVLAFGMETGGILEDAASARWLIAQVRTFFQAVPVGVDVAWTVDELAARRLVDDTTGVITNVDDVAIAALLTRVAEALRYWMVDDALRAEVRALLRECNGEIRRLWKTQGRRDPRVDAHCCALTTALHACAVPNDDFALGRVVHASVYGGTLFPWSTATIDDAVRAEFLALLREAG